MIKLIIQVVEFVFTLMVYLIDSFTDVDVENFVRGYETGYRKGRQDGMKEGYSNLQNSLRSLLNIDNKD